MRINGNDPRFDLVVAGGTVVSSAGRFAADVGVRDGRIVALGEELATAGAEVIDASGSYVLPGVIDPHVHPIHAETFGTVSEAAAVGGVTTLLHFIYVESDRGLVESLREAREEGEATSLLDFGLHARLTDVPRRLPELPAAVEMGVRSFKLFTAYRSRGIMVEDDDLFAAMQAIADVGGLAMTHAENGAIIDVLESQFRATGRTRAEDYPHSRPAIAEAEAVHRVAVLARVAGCPLYVVHVSCIEALDEVTRARSSGQEIYGETCPQYLALDADEAMPRFGMKAKIAPPLRTRADIDELWRAVADRRIDIIGSDHSAYSEADKTPASGSMLDAGFGAPGLETMLPLMHEEGVNRGRITLERMVEVLAEAPARIFGLPAKGGVMPGKDADLVIFDPEMEKTISDDDLHGRAYYSLYAGTKVRGVPRTVLQRGAKIVEDGRLVGGAGQGRFLPSQLGAAPASTPAQPLLAGAARR
jgi:dihydropyrimidinase